MEDGNHTFVDAYGFVRPLEEKDVIDALQKKVAERDAARAIKWKKEKLFADVTKHASIDKLKPHCRLGIPSTLRGDVWLVVSGASVAMATNEDKYAQLIDRMSMINFSMSKPIETDVRRTFPNHVDFAGDGSDMDKPLVRSLRNALTAQAVNVASVGYCQGLNFVAALLLLVTKDEEKSFYILSNIVDEKLAEYHTADMSGLILDVEVIKELIAERLPALTEHFKANDVDIGPLITPWLLTVFVIDTRTHVMFRIWDAFLLEGVKVLIRVVLAIFTIHEQHLLTVTGSDDLFVRIKQLPGETTDGDELMQVAFGLKKFKWQHIQQKRITLFQQWSQ